MHCSGRAHRYPCLWRVALKVARLGRRWHTSPFICIAEELGTSSLRNLYPRGSSTQAALQDLRAALLAAGGTWTWKSLASRDHDPQHHLAMRYRLSLRKDRHALQVYLHFE
jgi:hypothetical protein